MQTNVRMQDALIMFTCQQKGTFVCYFEYWKHTLTEIHLSYLEASWFVASPNSQKYLQNLKESESKLALNVSADGCLFSYVSPALTWGHVQCPELIRIHQMLISKAPHYFEHPNIKSEAFG